MAVTKSFSVEFDDALLDLEGWKAPRFEGSKLKARKLNEFQRGTGKFLGSNPVVDSTDNDLAKGTYKFGKSYPHGIISASNWGGDIMGPRKKGFDFVAGEKGSIIPLGTSLIGGEDEDFSLVRIDNHSYATIDRFLLINKDENIARVIQAEEFHSSSLMPLIGSICKEGSTVNVKLLQKGLQNNLRPGGYKVKSNIGLFAKIYGYEPPRVRLTNGRYQTSSFFGTTGNDGVVVSFSTNKKLNNPIRQFNANGTSLTDSVSQNMFSYGQVLTGSFNTASATVSTDLSPLTKRKFGTMFFRPSIKGDFKYGHSGSLTDMYSGSFHTYFDNKLGRPFKIPEIYEKGVLWEHSTHFTSIASTSGATNRFSASRINHTSGEDTIGVVISTGFEGVTQKRNPLREFINTKVFGDISSSANRYFITMESGNFGVRNNKLESICTGELRLPLGGGEYKYPWMDRFENQVFAAFGTEALWAKKGGLNEDGQIDRWGWNYGLNIGLSDRGIPSILSGSDFNGLDHKAPGGRDGNGVQSVSVKQGTANSGFPFNAGGGYSSHGGQGVHYKYTASFAYPYSGYQLSILREQPTLILNIPKDIALPAGIGNKGYALIPENLDPEILSNIEYYFEKAGLFSTDKSTQFRFGRGMT